MILGPYTPGLLVPDLLRGVPGQVPDAPAPHQLPLCTYCGHSHLLHQPRCQATGCRCDRLK